MKDAQAASVTFQATKDLLERVDQHAERLGARGVRVSRSDAIRNAIERGLQEYERRSGTVRGETGSASPKTRRGE